MAFVRMFTEASWKMLFGSLYPVAQYLSGLLPWIHVSGGLNMWKGRTVGSHRAAARMN